MSARDSKASRERVVNRPAKVLAFITLAGFLVAAAGAIVLLLL